MANDTIENNEIEQGNNLVADSVEVGTEETIEKEADVIDEIKAEAIAEETAEGVVAPRVSAGASDSSDDVEVERDFRRGGGDKKKFFYTKKVCKFCTKQIDEKNIDYKNIELMRKFVMPSGKIVPRRINGSCARHQRRVSEEIKKARIIALLPFLDR
jgi:small subunit ribosomal protein S18